MPQKKFDPSCLFTFQLFYNPVSDCKIMEHQITVGRMWKPAVHNSSGEALGIAVCRVNDFNSPVMEFRFSTMKLKHKY